MCVTPVLGALTPSSESRGFWLTFTGTACMACTGIHAGKTPITHKLFKNEKKIIHQTYWALTNTRRGVNGQVTEGATVSLSLRCAEIRGPGRKDLRDRKLTARAPVCPREHRNKVPGTAGAGASAPQFTKVEQLGSLSSESFRPLCLIQISSPLSPFLCVICFQTAPWTG